MGHPALLYNGNGYNLLLEWTEQDSFQLSTQGTSQPCYFLHAGYIGEGVYFQRDISNQIKSLTLPGYAYGEIYYKLS